MRVYRVLTLTQGCRLNYMDYGVGCEVLIDGCLSKQPHVNYSRTPILMIQICLLNLKVTRSLSGFRAGLTIAPHSQNHAMLPA